MIDLGQEKEENYVLGYSTRSIHHKGLPFNVRLGVDISSDQIARILHEMTSQYLVHISLLLVSLTLMICLANSSFEYMKSS